MKIIYRYNKSSYNELLDRSKLHTLLIARLCLLLCGVFKPVQALNPKYISDICVEKEPPCDLRNVVVSIKKIRTTTYGLQSVMYYWC